MTSDHKARGGVSEAEENAVTRAIWKEAGFVIRPATARAALEAAAQVRSGQDHGGEANEMIGTPLYTEADAARWQSEMDQRMTDCSKLGDAYNALAKELAAASARAAQAVERIKALEEALRPFAKAGELFRPRDPDDYDQVVYKPAAGPAYEIYGDHLRAATTLLSDHLAPEPGVEAGEVGTAFCWAMDEIDRLSNRLCGFAYPQGMAMLGREDQQEAYVAAVYARRRALQTPADGGRDGK